MSKKLLVYQSASYCEPLVSKVPGGGASGEFASEIPSLKQLVQKAAGKNIRRIDRLTQLALIASLECVKDFNLTENTGLYFGSACGSINNMMSVLKEIYVQGEMPMPLSFVNTVSNTACYYLSQQLGLQANNIFVSRENFALEGCFKLAAVDVLGNRIDAALVGVVSEGGEPLAAHRKRLGLMPHDDFAEGSQWFLLANHALENHAAIASIEAIHEPIDFESLEKLLIKNQAKHVVFGRKVPPSIRDHLVRKLRLADFNNNEVTYEFAVAQGMHKFLSSDSAAALSGNSFFTVDSDGGKRWSAMEIKSKVT